jgi:hypothetical protein
MLTNLRDANNSSESEVDEYCAFGLDMKKRRKNKLMLTGSESPTFSATLPARNLVQSSPSPNSSNGQMGRSKTSMFFKKTKGCLSPEAKTLLK